MNSKLFIKKTNEMKCDNKNSRVLHWLNNELSEKDRLAFEAHLKDCAACQQELREAQAIFDKMEAVTVPVPSSNMETRFLDLLQSYKQSANKPSFWKSVQETIRSQLSSQPGFRLAYSIILLVTGTIAGYFLFHQPVNNNTQEQLSVLSNKVEDMRQTMILSLLDNPSPGERMRAISYAEEAGTVNEHVIEALFITLNEDPNVNVRLATLDALAGYGKNPQVRKKLVQSIPLQESPLVQAALADIMLRLREKASINSFKSLLGKQKISTPVKDKIEKTIQILEI